ncbi:MULTISPECIES: PepSY domain-containing protein [unclassified Achromobacter]|uniref:PepSY domain-containing protein n=1 Tax=unclassified Achromobacter TaxID=2626865 RepID=UPI000B51A2C1|nr:MULTISPECIES: PepSY domain-containing protein [unclassified Achromobacter]OWT80436.1 peptidase [Achromobacter sp. HZ34]OWT82319.1 peptidase [Achromobacter sp. HZ28]
MKTAWPSFKRAVYLVHRWMGIAACLLMVLWFVSGVVMLFVGYPKLTPWERMAHLPALDAASLRVSAADAMAQASVARAGSAQAGSGSAGAPPARAAPVTEIVLTSVAGRPVYRLRDGSGRLTVVDANTGLPLPRAGPAQAEAAGRSWAVAAGPASAEASGPAMAGSPGITAHYLDTVTEDRWTHSGALNPHRPLLRVQLDDAARTLLYVSSATGEVVLDAPLAQRAWNYVGAWLHWLYFLRDRPVDAGWSWIVIVLSAGGTIVAVTGTLAGIWRWRFRGRYKSGARTPYRDFYLRWHHITGLVFAAITCTWIFSGLMSMNPLAVFAPAGPRPDVAAYRGGLPSSGAPGDGSSSGGAPSGALPEGGPRDGAVRPAIEAADALHLLHAASFVPREIAWRALNGQGYLLARDGADRTRLVLDGGTPRVQAQWSQAALRSAAARLKPAPVADMQLLDRYDDYYYERAPEAMNGGLERRLPVWRLKYADQADTWIYLDPHTGDMALSVDRAQRRGRWLFNFLHSWDLPALLRDGSRQQWWRLLALIVLSAGGLALSLTGVVIGTARLRRKVRFHGSPAAAAKSSQQG